VHSSRLSVQFSCSVVSDSLQPHELQHARPPCPSPTPGVQTHVHWIWLKLHPLIQTFFFNSNINIILSIFNCKVFFSYRDVAQNSNNVAESYINHQVITTFILLTIILGYKWIYHYGSGIKQIFFQKNIWPYYYCN